MPWSVGSCLNFFLCTEQSPKSTSCSNLVSTLLIFKLFCVHLMNIFLDQPNLEEQLLQNEAQLANNEKISVSALYCIACMLHCVRCDQNRLKQILDFSLLCKVQCNRYHCWHWTETDDEQTSRTDAKPLQFWHYYETYLSCFDYKNIYWIVRLTFSFNQNTS